MLRTEIADGIATVTLERPHRLNALTWTMMDRLRETLAALGEDPEAGAVILTGAGRAFCSGLDLNEIDAEASPADLAQDVADHMAASVSPLAEAMLTSSTPVVVAVNGPCVGGAVGLALLADVAVAGRSAYFQVPHVAALHLVPDLGLTWALTRQVGRARALGMSLTGRRVPAEQAATWGLIWQVVDDEALVHEARVIARHLAARRGATVATRHLLDSGATAQLGVQLGDEAGQQQIRFTQEEASQAVLAFTRRGPLTTSSDVGEGERQGLRVGGGREPG